MKPAMVTWSVICGSVVGLVAYDVVAACVWGEEATESRVILDVASKYPIVPFAMGVLMGHFFASQHIMPLPSDPSPAEKLDAMFPRLA